MLLLPVLLGVAASTPNPWQLAVAGLALAGYLASATLQVWSRNRRPAAYRAPITVYATVAAALALLLAAVFPPVMLAALVVLPTGALVFRSAQPGTRRDLANSLLQVAQALVLVPVTAWVSGAWDPGRVLAYTLVAAGYQLGTVLVVRSVLRERGNQGFATLSAGFHVGLMLLAAALLPLPYAITAAGLAARAILLPSVQRRMERGSKPLKPVHVGALEAVCSISVVVVAFVVPIV